MTISIQFTINEEEDQAVATNKLLKEESISFGKLCDRFHGPQSKIEIKAIEIGIMDPSKTCSQVQDLSCHTNRGAKIKIRQYKISAVPLIPSCDMASVRAMQPESNLQREQKIGGAM